MSGSEAPVERPIRVLVVDADERVRESLCGLLAIGDRIDIIGGAESPGAAIERVSADHPDVVIVDPRLPGVDQGLDFLRRLRAADPTVRILAMCSADTLDDAGVRATADGCVRKTFRPAEVIAAIVATDRRTDAGTGA